MRGGRRPFLRLGKRHPRRPNPALVESDRLRACVQRHGLSEADLAQAGGCTRATIRAWLERGRFLAAHIQAGIRDRYSAETGGPG